ncbi:MAG: hypothetical protein ACK4K7_01685 [Allosphingosinicella sp.]|uniref:hypothetical protein n=1 Tax=Allosphingosinicella sp. TaxID=2823234 RepID=UPI003925431C
MLKTIGGIIAGLLVGFAVIMAVETLSQSLFPRPAAVDPRDRDAVSALIRDLPAGALGLVAFAWFAGALAGGLVAGRIVRRRWAAWTIAALVALAAVANIMLFEHPDWMQVMALIAPALGGLIAGHFSPRAVPAAAAAGETTREPTDDA